MKTPLHQILAVAGILALAAVTAPPAIAATGTWSATSGTWDTSATNWTGVSVTPWDSTNGPTNIANFTSTSGNASVSGSVFANQITYTAGSGSFALAGSGTVNLGGTTPAISVDLSRTLTVSSGLAGSTDWTKSGAGTLTLSGSNTFTGNLNISAGTVIVNNASGLGTTAGSTSVVSGAQLFLQSNITVTGEALAINGGGVSSTGALRSSGNNTWTGNITGGSSAPTVRSDSGLLTLSGAIDAGGDQFILNGNGNITASGNISNFRVIVGSDGLTGTRVLSGNNTYQKTVIRAGTLSVGSLNSVVGGTLSSNLGAPTTANNGTIDIGNTSNSATLIYTGSGETTDRVINLSGTTGGATLNQSGGGLLKFTSNLTATGAGAKTLTLTGSTSGTGELSGAIVNSSGNATSVVKDGTGQWTLSGNNTYTGSTTVSAGTLLINGVTNASSAVSVSSGAILGGSGTVNGATTLVSGTIGSSGNTLSLTSTLSSSGNSSVATGSTVNVTGGSTVTGGTLLVNGNLGGAINVTGGTVGGNGTTGALTVGASSTLAPGNSPGILNTGNLSLSGLLSMEINGVTVGTQYDQVNVLGAVNLLGGNTLAISLGYTPTYGTNFFLINNDGVDAIVGTLNGYAQGATFTLASQQWQISYTGNSTGNLFTGGNDLVIQAIPEPSTFWALLAGSLTCAVLLRRRGRA